MPTTRIENEAMDEAPYAVLWSFPFSQELRLCNESSGTLIVQAKWKKQKRNFASPLHSTKTFDETSFPSHLCLLHCQINHQSNISATCRSPFQHPQTLANHRGKLCPRLYNPRSHPSPNLMITWYSPPESTKPIQNRSKPEQSITWSSPARIKPDPPSKVRSEPHATKAGHTSDQRSLPDPWSVARASGPSGRFWINEQPDHPAKAHLSHTLTGATLQWPR